MALEVHVALLRGINVGGNKKLPMASLRDLLAGCGALDVRTYIQSGNAVFRMDPDAVAALPDALSAAIQHAHGFPVPTVLRQAADLVRLHEGFAFPDADPAHRHVAFLGGPVDPARFDALPQGRDRFALVGQELHLWCPEGLGRTDLPFPRIERAGPTVTVRNWRTVGALVGLCAEVAGG